MLEIESNNWLSTSENMFLPPLFSFYIYLTKGMKGWITFFKKILKRNDGIEKAPAYEGAF
ncbi:hypothetical protein EVS87_017690 [Bacillus altitudinis]|nr:hypothetical protein CFN77_17870 [Bacillus altitudinis]KLV23849.1 hypothetical protein ABW03_05915 [Bacillus altitudinis]KWZ66006.1 hypothetical protein HQ51_0213275 [Bacillus altitudinis]QEO63965.1 hypothetical protein EVS87_017690 [Bacillus altitudinis]